MKPAIFILGPSALPIAKMIASHLASEIHGPAGIAVDVTYASATTHLALLFKEGRSIVAICASGIVIRSLAPFLADKTIEPPVIAVAEDGSSVVPLLGGHHGANMLAREIAALVAGHAAITTASDIRLDASLDEPPVGFTLSDIAAVKPAAARLLAGEKLRLDGNAPWLAHLAQSDGSVPVRIDVRRHADSDRILTYHPKALAVGVGCERGTSAEEIHELVSATLAEHGLAPEAIACFASLDLKEDEAGINALGDVRFFSHTELNAESHRVIRPSQIVLAEVGTPSVAEASALAAAGPDSVLIVPKTKSKRATCAIASSPEPILTHRGRSRGVLAVIGLGPGDPSLRAPEATAKLSAATDWVGYDLYLDLAMDAHSRQVLHRFPLGGEEDRVKHAIALAKSGRRVALICSGDAGIYAMAALVYEMLDFDRCRIGVEVIPGISAFQVAAARTGGLIGHDFCAISLSDLLTPWEVIVQRVQAAAQGDFVIAFYNPRSKARNTHLADAMKILHAHRRPETPVVVSRSLGRAEESNVIVAMSEFDESIVDMMTVVLVGSSKSVISRRPNGSAFVYTPRGYSEKVRA